MWVLRGTGLKMIFSWLHIKSNCKGLSKEPWPSNTTLTTLTEAQKLSAHLDAYKPPFSSQIQIFDFSYPLKTTRSQKLVKTCNLTTEQDFWFKFLFSIYIRYRVELKPVLYKLIFKSSPSKCNISEFWAHGFIKDL